eukprot:10785550-Alexandrium_andersonii.AAC.1
MAASCPRLRALPRWAPMHVPFCTRAITMRSLCYAIALAAQGRLAWRWRRNASSASICLDGNLMTPAVR